MSKLQEASLALRPYALTALRLVAGVIMTVHGWLKLTDYPAWHDSLASFGMPAPDVFAPLAVACEFAGGIGLIVGLLTPLAALGVLSSMTTAITLVHAPHGLLAKDGGFEYPLIMGCVALYFVVRGAGPISLDHLIFRRRGEETPSGTHPRGWRGAHA